MNQTDRSKLKRCAKCAHLRGVDEPEEGDGSDAAEGGDEEAKRACPAQRGAAADEVVVQQQVRGDGGVDDPHQRYGQRRHHCRPSEHLKHAEACSQTAAHTRHFHLLDR